MSCDRLRTSPPNERTRVRREHFSYNLEGAVGLVRDAGQPRFDMHTFTIEVPMTTHPHVPPCDVTVTVLVGALTWVNRKAGIAVMRYGYGSSLTGMVRRVALVGPDGCAWLDGTPPEQGRFSAGLIKFLHERLREEFTLPDYERLFGQTTT